MSGLSILFPVYNDQSTVKSVIHKAVNVATQIAVDFEIIVVDDGSHDKSSDYVSELSHVYPQIKLIKHAHNLGYGAALKTAFANASHEWICATDGDDEYDLYDLLRLWRHRNSYDLLITFRYTRLYSGYRIMLSIIYNTVLRILFRTRYRDISTGLRLFRRSILDVLILRSNSPFIGAEFAIKASFEGFRVGEVGIQTFPRSIGRGSSTSYRNIFLTIRDIAICYREIFSQSYQNPRRAS